MSSLPHTMNWTKLLYVLIIVLLYVPMVFLGANVFFPQYTGTSSYYHPAGSDCYSKYPYPANPDTLTTTQREALDQRQRECQEEFNKGQEEFEQQKLKYEGKKYVFMALFNLTILLLALFVPLLQNSVALGLFLGSIATTFGATIHYFDTQSRIGFGILVVTFLAMLFFINRKKESLVDWKGKS